MRLIDIVLEVERVLQNNNISWRYVSSRNARTFLLEDGTSKVITMRYDPRLASYFIHETWICEGKANLCTDYHMIHGIEYLADIILDMLKDTY